jgi:hypothetical protein
VAVISELDATVKIAAVPLKVTLVAPVNRWRLSTYGSTLVSDEPARRSDRLLERRRKLG